MISSNFHNYPVARMNECARATCTTSLIAGGFGTSCWSFWASQECCTVCSGIRNAIYAATRETGQRVASRPETDSRERRKLALNSQGSEESRRSSES